MRVGDEDGERSGLGHAQTGAHHNALAGFLFLRLVQAVPDRLCERSTRIKKHAHARQQVAAQRVIGLHRVGNGFKAGRYIEVNRRRNLAQVAQGFGHQRRCRFAVVDIQRATMKQHHAKVVVAAKGMVPWQPVHQYRRHLAQHRHGLGHLLLVGAEHALGVDHCLGQFGRAAGEQKLHDGVRPRRLHGGINGSARRCRCEIIKACGGTPFDMANGKYQLNGRIHRGLDGFGITTGIGCKHQPRRHRGEHVPQLVVVLTDQRIWRRGRYKRHARQHAAQGQHGVLNVVLGQDHHRAVNIQATVDQTLCDGACARPGLRVGHMLPVAGFAVGQLFPPGDKTAVWRAFCPVLQALGDAGRIGLQRLLGAQVLGASLAVTPDDTGDAKRHAAEFRGAHAGLARFLFFMGSCRSTCGRQPFCTLAARPSRKAFTRLLASGALCATAAISASVKKPWSAGCSAMRGKACINA